MVNNAWWCQDFHGWCMVYGISIYYVHHDGKPLWKGLQNLHLLLARVANWPSLRWVMYCLLRNSRRKSSQCTPRINIPFKNLKPKTSHQKPRPRQAPAAGYSFDDSPPNHCPWPESPQIRWRMRDKTGKRDEPLLKQRTHFFWHVFSRVYNCVYVKIYIRLYMYVHRVHMYNMYTSVYI